MIGGIALSCLRSALYSVLAVSILATLFGTFNCNYRWWSATSTPWSRTKNPALTVYYHAMLQHAAKGNKGDVLLTGSATMKWITLFGGTLAAALSTTALRSLPSVKRSVNSPVRKLKIWIKQLSLYQLPPRSFWSWWCEGLSPVDLILWLGFWALMVSWAWQLTEGVWARIYSTLHQPTFKKRYPYGLHFAKTEAVATRVGFAAMAGFLCLFYLIPRNSFIQHLFRCDFSALLRYHRWVGHLALVALTLHGWLYYITWAVEGRFWEEFSQWKASGVANLAGTLAYVCCLALWVTSPDCVRRRYFEVFYRTHIAGFLGLLLFSAMHYRGTVQYMYQGLTLYLLDLTYRLAQWMNTSVVTGSLISENLLTLDLRFDPRVVMKPQATVWVCVPKASSHQFHPFTISSVLDSHDPSKPTIAKLAIKPYGKWAKCKGHRSRMVQAVVREIVAHGSTAVKVDGPYGEPTEVEAKADTPVLLVAGGVGVTPILGMLSLIQEDRLRASGKLSKVHFVWATRNPNDFFFLDPALVEEAAHPDGWLKISLYATAGPAKPYLPGTVSDMDMDMDRQKAAQLAFAQSEALGSSPHGAQHAAYVARRTSPFFFSPSLLQGYGMGSLDWALAHILSFVGAFLCTLTVSAYDIVPEFTGPTSPGWSYGLLSLIAYAVGAMGLPALFLFPKYMLRHWRDERRERALDSPASSTSYSPVKGLDVERGHGHLPMEEGRPDIEHILQDMLNQSKASEVSVHSAGPQSLVEEVRRACAECSSSLGVFVHAHTHSFSL